MKVIAAIQADLEDTPLGTRSRLAEESGGVTILRRTVERTRRVQSVDAVYVLCPAPQLERCQSLLEETGVVVRAHDLKPPPWRPLVQTARKWSLDGWRGGLGGTTGFDEYTDCRVLKGLLQSIKADAVLSVPPAAPLLDPDLAERMIRHRTEVEEEVRMVFTQAPPGLTGVLLDAGLIRELAEKNSPISWTFSYQPDNPRKDLIFQPCCYDVPREVRHAVGRLIADTDRSMQMIRALLDNHDSPDAIPIGRWLMDRSRRHVEPLPRELEIELTTEDPYPEALLRPLGERVGHRGPIEPGLVEQVISEVNRYDDALVVLGGFGDPLRHPQFSTILEAVCRNRGAGRGVYGLAVRTTAVDLTDDLIDALVTREVDVLNVTLDAWSAGLYGRLQSPNDPDAAKLETVLARLDRLAEVRQSRTSVRPIVVPEMTKARENVHELDDFHDGWLRRIGAVTISGAGHYAGQVEDHGVIRMTPPTRFGCRRIGSRCLVLADGRVAVCDQDFRGRHTVGRIGDQSLAEIWQGEALGHIREAHQNERYDPMPLCLACEEWHRS